MWGVCDFFGIFLGFRIPQEVAGTGKRVYLLKWVRGDYFLIEV